ncbi:uncharacterized protein HD556DRAFT_1308068 [Suillus plorans]|uniref:Uncharacterized protein n=1 Tax=Suillus plorans TaxID=116603 RepID=A0A9P7AQP5_9AGAM|nr:uncharacterized protein HD556DRAFT_1308068 [Suillus plorans]KAG1794352.1 hypothetical protein HD556DRAFT_1308068 [Suillus plorans]
MAPALNARQLKEPNSLDPLDSWHSPLWIPYSAYEEKGPDTLASTGLEALILKRKDAKQEKAIWGLVLRDGILKCIVQDSSSRLGEGCVSENLIHQSKYLAVAITLGNYPSDQESKIVPHKNFDVCKTGLTFCSGPGKGKRGKHRVAKFIFRSAAEIFCGTGESDDSLFSSPAK